MSDELPDKPLEAIETEQLPHGVTLLAEAALHAPPPPPGAEMSSQARALNAYEDALRTPSELRAESWHPGAGGGIFAKLNAVIRRLRGR